MEVRELDAMVPRCRAAFYQDRIFDLDGLGQSRVEGFYLCFDFCKSSLQPIDLIKFAQLGELVCVNHVHEAYDGFNCLLWGNFFLFWHNLNSLAS